MLAKNKDWAGKVRIVGVSIDWNDPASVADHCNKAGWTSVEHYVAQKKCLMTDFDVKGVPHMMLIDKDGNVVFKGHPYHLDLEAAINKLLCGEKLA